MVSKLSLALIVTGLLCATSVAAREIDAGVAITDSEAMQELETRGFALSALFQPGWRRGAETRVLNNAEFADVAPIKALRDVVRAEFRKYNDNFLQRFREAEGSFGVGTGPDYRRFERNYLDSSAARFELVGVINRMDRGYRTPDSCGEIRLIYRLAYKTKAKDMVKTTAVENGRTVVRMKRTADVMVDVQSRMPMTINMVLRARPPGPAAGATSVTCQDLARRWIAAGESGRKGKALAQLLMADGGALATVEPAQIDRMETNIQVIRVPSTQMGEFGGNAEYLLHVFKWDPGARAFSMAKLENQIDREALLTDPAKLARLKAWLFTPEQMHALAEGTITIPEEFLAERAITSAPGGTARATNRPFLGIVSDAEADDAYRRLEAAARRIDPEGRLRNISSGFGLQQRLNDITCTGCHQSRAIGGFHFLGADWTSTIKRLPPNAIFVAGSPHFYGDLPRRRGIVEAIAAGRPADFMRGFSMRPRQTTGRSTKTVFPASFDPLRNGEGSNCYQPPGPGSSADPSFADWTCAAGLVCRAMHESALEPGMGVCMVDQPTKAALERNLSEESVKAQQKRLKIGQPYLFGRFTYRVVEDGRDPRIKRYRDAYCTTLDTLNNKPRRMQPRPPPGACLPTPGSKGNQPRDIDAAYQKGGFFGGMHRVLGCTEPTAKGTVCATEAGNGFNSCIDQLSDGKTSFTPCLTSVAQPATLQACSVTQPCRDDYVCLATRTSLSTRLGACLPPYFLFQFRIDGHPVPPEGPASDDPL